MPTIHFIPRTNDTIHPCVPESQKPCCQGFSLLRPKLLSQVNQLHLSMWSMCHELSHIGGPLRMPRLGHKLLMLHFLLYNGHHCQAGTRGLTVFLVLIPHYLLVGGTEFLRATHLSLQHAYTMPSLLLLSLQLMHLGSVTEGTVHVHLPGNKKIHPMMPAAAPATLSSRWELTACDAF